MFLLSHHPFVADASSRKLTLPRAPRDGLAFGADALRLSSSANARSLLPEYFPAAQSCPASTHDVFSPARNAVLADGIANMMPRSLVARPFSPLCRHYGSDRTAGGADQPT